MPALICRPDTGNHDDREARQSETSRRCSTSSIKMTAVLPGPSDEPGGEDFVHTMSRTRSLCRLDRLQDERKPPWPGSQCTANVSGRSSRKNVTRGLGPDCSGEIGLILRVFRSSG